MRYPRTRRSLAQPARGVRRSSSVALAQAAGRRALSALALGVLATVASAAAGAPAASAKTLWLCNPVTLKSDPCRPSMKTLVLSPSGERLRVETPRRPRRPAFDCFYVYPTVSDFDGPQAPLRIYPEQRAIAQYHAARFSLTCRVFAPVYRQITLRGITTLAGQVTERMREQAYADVRAAFREYLRRYNRGRRGVLLLGHSQGAFTLRRLVREEVDPKPSRRRILVSALLIGGNVLVRAGSDRGGDFRHLRLCTSARQVGCVVAYSVYGETPGSDAVFGDPRVSFGLPVPKASVEVACTNPANLRPGGSGSLDPIYPARRFAPGTTIGALTDQLGTPRVDNPGAVWLSAPGSYSARCVRANGRHVLVATPRGGAPALKPMPAPSWGLHLADVNIALGDLVQLVKRQGARWLAQKRR